MAYLDEDILYNNIEEKYKSAKGKAREAYSDVLDTICEMPRADVVPKSEVEELKAIIADHKASEERLEELYSNAKSEVEKIFAEIEERLLPSNTSGEFRGDSVEWFDYFDLHLAEDIAELKKKYVEV